MQRALLFVASLVMSDPVTHATERVARDAVELKSAIAAARPGDTIVLADGTWRDAAIRVASGGSADHPVVIRARTPGGVVLTGASSLTIVANHVEVSGLVFREGWLDGGSVVTFEGEHGALVDSAIINFNPADVATGYYWVYFDGNHNRVERCHFEGKANEQPVVGNDRTDSRHNQVVWCQFKDIPYVPDRNGREIFRIWGHGGNEEMGDDGAFFTIEHNRFERAHGEGMEIISLKSNRNVVRRNTIIRSRGGITNRSGNFNTIADNVVLCDGEPGAYGLRITGRYHEVARNFVRGGEYGLHLMAGEFIDRDLTGSYQPIQREGTPLGRVPAYSQPRDTVVTGNILVDNTGVDVLLGNGYKAAWPRAQRVLLPEGNHITGNVIFKTRGGVAMDMPRPDRSAPLDVFQFTANTFASNRVLGGALGAGLGGDLPGVAIEPLPSAAPGCPPVLAAGDVGPTWMRP